MPTYAMSSFNIPTKICDKLDALARRFWWKPKALDGKFVAWKAWDKLCQPKCKGGLGFKKAKDCNKALLAKLTWMVASRRDSLCMRILGAKYKVNHDWLNRDPPKYASPIWNAIEGAKEIMVKVVCYLIGDGVSINIWKDLWVPWIHNFVPKPRIDIYALLPQTVSQLIDCESRIWRASLVKELFEPTSAQAILSLPIPFN